MAITRPAFGKLLVTEKIVTSRRKAKACATFLWDHLQGRSLEAHYALVPRMMNAALAPSTSAAKTIVVLAFEQWTGIGA
jgi:hypothetical protein